MNIRILGYVITRASVVPFEVTAPCLVPEALCLTCGTQAAFLHFLHLLLISDKPSRDQGCRCTFWMGVRMRPPPTLHGTLHNGPDPWAENLGEKSAVVSLHKVPDLSNHWSKTSGSVRGALTPRALSHHRNSGNEMVGVVLYMMERRTECPTNSVSCRTVFLLSLYLSMVRVIISISVS